VSLPKPSRSQLAVGVVITIAVAIVGGLVWGFGQQLALARQVRAEETWMEQRVADEQAHHDDLAEQLAYVKSDEYVEHWARAEAKMARQGEVAVIVPEDLDEETTNDAQPTPTPEPKAQPFWAELWELLFAPPDQ
jgi:cell division protein FtsB